MPEGFHPPQGLKLTDTITRAGADSLRNQALALKFRLLSIRLTLEVIETNRNLSAIAISKEA
jgi:hypothetical protein